MIAHAKGINVGKPRTLCVYTVQTKHFPFLILKQAYMHMSAKHPKHKTINDYIWRIYGNTKNLDSRQQIYHKNILDHKCTRKKLSHNTF